MSVLRAGRGRGGGGGAGGGGGWMFLVTEIFFPQKHLPGVLKRKKKIFKNVPGVLKRMHKILFLFGGGVFGAPHAPTGGRAGSENDTLLPMTMTCDQLKFWSGPAVKNYHTETLAAEE